MPGFKDLMKKAKEMAEKGVSMVKEAMAFEQLLKDFDEVVANTIVEVLQGQGYRSMGQEEQGGYYVVRLAIDDFDKVKHVVDRDLLRRYSPKDREKILNVIPDMLVVRVRYARRGASTSTLLSPTNVEDVTVEADLSYFVERKGGFFSKVKRDQHRIRLGQFSFKSSDFVDYEKKEIDREKLRGYLESKLRGFGLI